MWLEVVGLLVTMDPVISASILALQLILQLRYIDICLIEAGVALVVSSRVVHNVVHDALVLEVQLRFQYLHLSVEVIH